MAGKQRRNKEDFKKRMKCEVCKEVEEVEHINFGLDIGFHIGDYAKGHGEVYKDLEIKPSCWRVSSIKLCCECYNALKSKRFIDINLMDELKKVISSRCSKEKILLNLREGMLKRLK